MLTFSIIELLVKKKKIVKVLAIYEHGGHLCHVTETNFINSSPSFPRSLHIKFDFDMQSFFQRKRS